MHRVNGLRGSVTHLKEHALDSTTSKHDIPYPDYPVSADSEDLTIDQNLLTGSVATPRLCSGGLPDR
jgi:hypothetical protein